MICSCLGCESLVGEVLLDIRSELCLRIGFVHSVGLFTPSYRYRSDLSIDPQDCVCGGLSVLPAELQDSCSEGHSFTVTGELNMLVSL